MDWLILPSTPRTEKILLTVLHRVSVNQSYSQYFGELGTRVEDIRRETVRNAMEYDATCLCGELLNRTYVPALIMPPFIFYCGGGGESPSFNDEDLFSRSTESLDSELTCSWLNIP